MSAALLIDDDAGVLEMIENAASAMGLDLMTASTWEEGLALFHILSPDVVVADYNLPGSRHGLHLLSEIKQLRPSVRVILISGVVGPDDLERVVELGVVDRVLSKGSSIETTRALLEEAEAAGARASQATDWAGFARSFLDARAIPAETLDELDSYLRSQVGE